MRTKFDIQNENQMLRAKIKKKNQLRKGSKTKQKKATKRMMIKSNIKIK